MKIRIRPFLFSIIFATLLASVVALIAGGTTHERVKSYRLNSETLEINQSNTVIYDRYGNQLAFFKNSQKEYVPYEDIPIEFIQAAISIEDREFFKHSGINVESIFRAFIVNLQSDGYEQGGSTITQQLVKSNFLTSQKSFVRKQQEAILSSITEQTLSKKDIISYYVNHNFYGNRAYGIKNAVETYFGQTLEEFNNDEKTEKIAKAALLMALPNAPSFYNPYENPEPTLQRRNNVLSSMYIEGYITKKEYETALKHDFLVLEEPNSESKSRTIFYPEIVHYVLNEAAEKLNKDLDEVIEGGYRIETAFDPYIYHQVRKHISNPNYYPRNPSETEKIQGATVIIDPKTSELLAFTGAREDLTELSVFNRAFQMKRQPGSAFKPLIAYGPALESGRFSQYSGVSCQNTFGNYRVRDGSCYGSKTMAEALRVSNNGPAVWTLNSIGIDYATKYVENLGIDLTTNDTNLSIALGGLYRGVSPLELANAYQVYANEGMMANAYMITELRNTDGTVMLKRPEQVQKINVDNANEMDQMLRRVVTSGTGRKAYIPGEKMAGKTGTSERATGRGNMDIWFVGFNDEIVSSVWMGYDQTDDRNFIPPRSTSSITAHLFGRMVKDVITEKREEKVRDLDSFSINLRHSIKSNHLQISWEDRKNEWFEVYKNGRLIEVTESGNWTDYNVISGENYEYQVHSYRKDTGEKQSESNIVQLNTNKSKP